MVTRPNDRTTSPGSGDPSSSSSAAVSSTTSTTLEQTAVSSSSTGSDVKVSSETSDLSNSETSQSASVLTYSGSTTSLYTTATSSATTSPTSASASSTSAVPATAVSKFVKCPDSTGTIVGAAVGTGIGAALLTFLITFLVMRSRRKSGVAHSRSSERGPPGPSNPYFEKTPESKTRPLSDIVPILGGASWMEHLPQPADDEKIRRSMKTLYHQIELHVENFYSDTTSSQISESAQAEMYKLDSELMVPSLYDMMMQSRSKIALIKHTFAWLILTNIDAYDVNVAPLLPPDLTILTKTLRNADPDNLKPGESSPFNFHPQVSSTALLIKPSVPQLHPKHCPNTASWHHTFVQIPQPTKPTSNTATPSSTTPQPHVATRSIPGLSAARAMAQDSII